MMQEDRFKRYSIVLEYRPMSAVPEDGGEPDADIGLVDALTGDAIALVRVVRDAQAEDIGEQWKAIQEVGDIGPFRPRGTFMDIQRDVLGAMSIRLHSFWSTAQVEWRDDICF